MKEVPDLLKIERGCISAPAGCGKTHLIASTLARHDGAKPILVLTHTNAGVAALKKRLDGLSVPARNYRLTTIDGWALQLISTFPGRSGHNPALLELKIPSRDYPALKKHALGLLNAGHVSDVLKASYSRLFVDEYQDCMKPQHDIVIALAGLLPTCVLGDDLQCIFGWSGPKVDWDSEVLKFFPLVGELDVPYRWDNVDCHDLGQWLLDIRPLLRSGSAIDLLKAPKEVEWMQIDGPKDAPALLKAARTPAPVKGGSILILCAGTDKARQQNVARHTPGAVVVENVDLTDFVKFAETFSFDDAAATSDLIDFAASVMTGVDGSSMKARINALRNGTATKAASAAEQATLDFAASPSPMNANKVLVEINKQAGVRPHRPAILSACLRTLNSCEDAERFHELAMLVREQQRVVGREIKGRAVGSTLLLKGLEADVAVLLDTSSFSAQDLYVALTRGARKIVVCSESSFISPR
ncbi:UvrD-helicase domain-containing protein [Mesorhizobium sp. CO1-1-9]|uniref:UvrD-helicase domain-containing protein n=1 Tax=Mesorhizobium sp. CO1-1-9 TaxID=2876630 RepID=UPI001CCD9C17|nr:UvrD-helicase domain-containing protein [Mesorhizobium sp. CO1-1-9]MBZ9694896.1 UvrD-helicase domain-containing protein [Mesorhizobium sp. CO1-1-9]